MQFNLILSSVAMTCLLGQARAATVVLDTFQEGAHQLAVGIDSSDSEIIDSPMGFTVRATRINRIVPPETTVTSTLSQPSAAVEFRAAGMGIAINDPPQMRIGYVEGGPYSLSGYSAFELDVAVIAGRGNLIIELGSQTDIYGPETRRIPINTSGVVTVPFGEVNFGPTGSLDSFYAMHFTFEAATEEYELTLSEIRVVPEPANLSLLAVSSFGLVAIRRRHAWTEDFKR
jgi:hypothetical protein